MECGMERGAGGIAWKAAKSRSNPPATHRVSAHSRGVVLFVHRRGGSHRDSRFLTLHRYPALPGDRTG
jgi:hypothetical protein